MIHILQKKKKCKCNSSICIDEFCIERLWRHTICRAATFVNAQLLSDKIRKCIRMTDSLSSDSFIGMLFSRSNKQII